MKNVSIFQPISQPYLPSDYHATATLLSRYGNVVVLLRQHCCPATAISLFCYGNKKKYGATLIEQRRNPMFN